MSGETPPPDYAFGTTHWSRIADVAEGDTALRRRSLEWLCRQYWKPIHAHLRRFHAMDPSEAEDRTQEFFAYLLEHHVIPKADPEIARFRTFIKAVLRNFLSAERRAEEREKRGGGKKILSLDLTAEEEESPMAVASPEASPDEVLDREWARRMWELARDEMGRELQRAGNARHFEIFEAYSNRTPRPTYADLAGEFGISDWEVWKILSAVRERLRAMVRLNVSETVRRPEDVDTEMEYLVSLLGSVKK